MNDPLLDIISGHKKGRQNGIYSVCSSHRMVLRAAMAQALQNESMLLIESTSNQVDQFGGYSGMTPARFVEYIRTIAQEANFPLDCLILGGDHLGLNRWQNESSSSAMKKAKAQVKAYTEAGYTKIHLDTSMRCADDPENWHPEPAGQVMAERAAVLCQVVENTVHKDRIQLSAPVYVIGTEVPVPGGARHAISDIAVTTVDQARHTIESTREAFLKKGLEDAWGRVIAMVVQPGLEFDHFSVIDYKRENARSLSRFIETVPGLIYEVHSTDYQTPASLRALVEDHFAILKVGPALTFAFREAVQALAIIEEIFLGGRKGITCSALMDVMERLMTGNPEHWRHHYHDLDFSPAMARQYSYSDRIRYYWPLTKAMETTALLINNLNMYPPPLSLVSQYLPVQYQAVREGQIGNKPLHLIEHKIREILKQYASASRPLKHLSQRSKT